MFFELNQDYNRSNRSKTVFMIMFIYRLGNKIFYSSLPKFVKKPLLFIFTWIYNLFVYFPYHIEIPFCCKIGGGLRLVHYHGIVISGSAIIGNNCTIFHQVTIGINELSSKIKAAKIGNNVFIGCGAKIIGEIEIGNNVKIGANAVIVKNIPDDAICYCTQNVK